MLDDRRRFRIYNAYSPADDRYPMIEQPDLLRNPNLYCICSFHLGQTFSKGICFHIDAIVFAKPIGWPKIPPNRELPPRSHMVATNLIGHNHIISTGQFFVASLFGGPADDFRSCWILQKETTEKIVGIARQNSYECEALSIPAFNLGFIFDCIPLTNKWGFIVKAFNDFFTHGLITSIIPFVALPPFLTPVFHCAQTANNDIMVLEFVYFFLHFAPWRSYWDNIAFCLRILFWNDLMAYPTIKILESIKRRWKFFQKATWGAIPKSTVVLIDRHVQGINKKYSCTPKWTPWSQPEKLEKQ